MSACLHSCLLRCLCWRGDQLLHASRRGGHEASALSTQSRSALSPGARRLAAGLSECGDSDSLFLSSATQECVRSSATPQDFRSSATPQDFWSSATPADVGIVNSDHCSATMCKCMRTFA